MQSIESNIMNKVFEICKDYSSGEYADVDVKKALDKERLSFGDFMALLSPVAENYLDEMAKRAKAETKKHFGNSINLYTPLYISNYCVNHCLYCGFNKNNVIQRGKLTFKEIEEELMAISQTGLREILLLTGEDREHSSIEYIGQAIKIATNYFSSIGIEIYPLNVDEYSFLKKCGADFVSVYQETYNPDIYKSLHQNGPKEVYFYRFESQERALQSGMRGVSFGALFGLGDFRADAFCTGIHAYLIQKKYPQAEISFSVPRLRTFTSDTVYSVSDEINEKQLFQIMLSFRVFMPFASIAISTRERERFRDNVIGIAATKISAEVRTCVGGHIEKKGDEQFDISDKRDVTEIDSMLRAKGFQPVYADHIRL